MEKLAKFISILLIVLTVLFLFYAISDNYLGQLIENESLIIQSE